MPRTDGKVSTTKPSPSRTRQSWVAILLSLLLPGLGHLYAGRPDAAWKRFGLVLAVSVLSRIIAWFTLGPASLIVGALAMLSAYVWVAFDAFRIATRSPTDYTLRGYNRWYVYVGCIIVAIGCNTLLTAAIHAGVGRSFRVDSGAMEPTLHAADFIFTAVRGSSVDDLELGAIVAFEAPEERGLYIIMRVCGLPHDTLAMRGGVLFVNGVAVDEPYAIETNPEEDPDHPMMLRWQPRYLVGVDQGSYRATLKNWGPLEVPPDSVFVLGDNRDNSFDGRFYGFVGGDRIYGRPTKIYFSYDPADWRPLPFLTAIRWHRIGLRL